MKFLERIALRAPLKPLALACAAALGLGGIALATPIITDTFTRADGALNGSSPEFGTGTWSTTNAWNVTSGEAASPAGEGSAYIPIGHVTPGNTYTFTVQARNGGSWYWAGLGFSNTNTSTYFGNTGQYGLRTNSGELQIFESGAYKGSPAGGNFTVNNQFKLVLDTTSGYAWTIGCFLNGSETPIYTMTLAPSLDINYVMVSSNNDGGGTSIFDNVQVTVAEGTPLAFTTTTVVSSDYITAVGDPVTFTATIVPASGSAFPAGNVQFKLDGVNKGSAVPVTQVGSTSNGTAAIAGITDIPAGQAHVVTAEYLPDPGFVISTGTLSPNQTVLSPAQSIVVYDTFTRADSVLNGSSPETGPGPWNVHTTQTELWNVVSGAVTSGWLSAFVPIGTVTSGKIYTASADMTNVTSSWMMLGFSDVNTAVDVEAGIVWRTNGGGGQLFSNNVYQGDTGGASPAKHNYSMVLDTTNPVAWNEKVIVDGVTLSDHAVTPQLAFQYAIFNGYHMILDNVVVTVEQAITLVTTETTVVSSNYTTTFSDPVTFTATIVPASGSAFPAGNVQFMLDGTTDLGLVAVTQDGITSHGIAATPSITTIPVGSAHVVTALYIPATGSGFVTSTGTLNPNQTVLVPAGSTTTTVASSQNPSNVGGPVTFTATIVPYPDSGAFPVGNVQFMLDGTTDLGLVAVTQVGSTAHGTAATTSITTIPLGSAHVVTALYIPTIGSGFFTSTGTLSPNQVVLPAGLTAIVYDSFTRADALLNGSSPEVGTGTWNTTAAAAWNIISGEAVSPAGESAAFIPIGQVTSGKTYTFTVDARHGESWYWTGLAFAGTNTSPSVPFAAGVYGLRFNAGEVQIWENGEYKGTPAGGDFSVNNQFKFVLDTTSLTAWTIGCFLNGSETPYYTMTLAPSVDINYVMLNSQNNGGSTPTFDNVLVTVAGVVSNVDTTTTVFSLAPNPSTFGGSVTLTAHVDPTPSGPLPTGGTVQFYDNGTPFGGTVPVVSGVATLTPYTSFSVGTHPITASFSGTDGFNASPISSSVDQVVNAARTAYELWTDSKGLNGVSGSGSTTDPSPTADPDKDGVKNFIEFAFNGDPKSAANTGMVYSTTENSTLYGQKVLVLTVAVRVATPAADWANNTATIDGLTYSIEGGMTLGDFSSSISRVLPYDNNTGPGSAGTNYEWRRFMLTESAGLLTKGFLRAKVVQN